MRFSDAAIILFWVNASVKHNNWVRWGKFRTKTVSLYKNILKI